MWHSFEKYSDLCDLFNEIFKTGNLGVTTQTQQREEKEAKIWGTHQSNWIKKHERLDFIQGEFENFEN